MLGLTIEKLIIIAVLVGFLFGPERLVSLSQQLGSWVRAGRDWIEQAQHRAQSEFGNDGEQWAEFDPRRYDPRRIIRDALDEDSDPAASRKIARDPAAAPAMIRRRRSDGHWETIPAEVTSPQASR